MGTWQLIDKPQGVVPIANKFVFTKKRDKDGNVTKYKARLVAKGCAQQPGFDYLKTHSPVVRIETLGGFKVAHYFPIIYFIILSLIPNLALKTT